MHIASSTSCCLRFPEPMIDQWQNADVLIAGGLGFIGSPLARRLVAMGARVTIADCLLPDSGGNRHNIRDIETQVEVIITDLRNKQSVFQLVKNRSYVFN